MEKWHLRSNLKDGEEVTRHRKERRPFLSGRGMIRLRKDVWAKTKVLQVKQRMLQAEGWLI